ncbi:hypothetical protein AAOGI_44620 [Agarivorans albus]
MFNKKKKLIMGGTGPFAKRLVKLLQKGNKPKGVIIYSRGELKKNEMQQKIKQP